ncbi:MAG TPA: hypothetical protein VJX92_10635 [Methylomirabilota bacterium]|nr:hypothetical protein [Methylomirabilota bacterium]
MSVRRARFAVTLTLVALALGPTRAWADDSEWAAAEKTTRERVAELAAALPSESPGKKLAAMAEQAGSDRRALAELYRAQDEYVTRTLAEWRDGPERKALQDATLQLQRSAERASAALRAAAEGADSVAIRLRHSGVFGKVGRLDAAAKDAVARLAGRWERERAMREREKEQREREAGERARDQRRN